VQKTPSQDLIFQQKNAEANIHNSLHALQYKKSKSDLSRGHSQSVTVNDQKHKKDKKDRRNSPGAQYKNSTDQDFSGKMVRKTKTAGKNDQDSNEQPGRGKPADPSSSLDELELLGGGENHQAVKTAPVSNHRRARSSLGGQRKSSAK
jgi:hypothetical protein